MVISAAVALAACTSSGSTSPTPSPTSTTATVSATPTADPAAEQVLTSYRAYWAARVEAQAKPTERLPKDLTRYGTGTAVSDVRATVLLFRQQGIELHGKPTLTPKVTAAEEATATISDCVDSTNWKPVYAATGKSALAAGQPKRVVMSATATKTGDRWLIKSAMVDRDRTC